MNEPERPFEEPWQAQAFAMTVCLHQSGAFSWTEWANALSKQIEQQPQRPYYNSWLAALEQITADKKIVSPALLSKREQQWHEAAARTPHGEPIELLKNIKEQT